jgi:hypothetical protein
MYVVFVIIWIWHQTLIKEIVIWQRRLNLILFLSCRRKFHMNWTSFKRSPVLYGPCFVCPKGDFLIQVWLYLSISFNSFYFRISKYCGSIFFTFWQSGNVCCICYNMNLTSDINKGNCYMTTTFDKHKVIVSFKWWWQ